MTVLSGLRRRLTRKANPCPEQQSDERRAVASRQQRIRLQLNALEAEVRAHER